MTSQIKSSYFKELVQAELARLHALHLEHERFVAPAISHYRYTNKSLRSILKSYRPKAPRNFLLFAQMARFISL